MATFEHVDPEAPVDHSSDRTHGISSAVGRTVHQGRRAVRVRSDSSKVQIASLLDLLELHLRKAPPQAPITNDQEVVVLLDHARPEAIGALATLSRSMMDGPRVRLIHTNGSTTGEDPLSGWDMADEAAHYLRWRQLLERQRKAPPIVIDLVRTVNRPELRAYPMLSSSNDWSVRLEGLQVGVVTTSGGTFSVGRDRGGRRSAPRQAWLDAVGREALTLANDKGSIARVSESIRTFAREWLDASSSSAKAGEQNEHALESRILRGSTPLSAATGVELDLIKPDDGFVNWGSQFPTKWGPGGRARYLDALLREGQIPWAIEMKVQGGGGVGQYYRHAVAQAVLYREFIIGAKPLHPWFEVQDLQAASCRAAVVVPRIASPEGRKRLEAMCAMFRVDLIEVDAGAALLRSSTT